MSDDLDPIRRSTPGATPPSDVPTSPGAAEMRLGDWVLGAEIGRGAMGVVYRARHASDGRVAAVKVLSPRLAADERFVERFERETRALTALSHPNVVAILDQGVTDGLPWYAMEFVEGGNIRSWTRPGNMNDGRLLRFAIGVCEGLASAHARGIVHRDIKPENLLIGLGGQPKISDFGLARLFGDRWMDLSRLSVSGGAVGTPYYMAPELLKGQPPDDRADLYSLGVVLYEALSGDLPVGRVRRLREVRSTIDPRVDDLVMRLLEPDRDRRPASAGEVARLLDRILKSTYLPPDLLVMNANGPPSVLPGRLKLLGLIGSSIVIAVGAYGFLVQGMEPDAVAVAAVLIALAVAIGLYGKHGDD